MADQKSELAIAAVKELVDRINAGKLSVAEWIFDGLDVALQQLKERASQPVQEAGWSSELPDKAGWWWAIYDRTPSLIKIIERDGNLYDAALSPPIHTIQTTHGPKSVYMGRCRWYRPGPLSAPPLPSSNVKEDR